MKKSIKFFIGMSVLFSIQAQVQTAKKKKPYLGQGVIVGIGLSEEDEYLYEVKTANNQILMIPEDAMYKMEQSAQAKEDFQDVCFPPESAEEPAKTEEKTA